MNKNYKLKEGDKIRILFSNGSKMLCEILEFPMSSSVDSGILIAEAVDGEVCYINIHSNGFLSMRRATTFESIFIESKKLERETE